MSIRPIVVLTLAACGGHGGVTPDAPPECTETESRTAGPASAAVIDQ